MSRKLFNISLLFSSPKCHCKWAIPILRIQYTKIYRIGEWRYPIVHIKSPFASWKFNSLFSKVKIGKLKWNSSDSIKEGASLCSIRQNFRLKSAFFEWPIVNTFHNVKQNMSQFANEISKFQIYVKSPKLVCDSHAKDADWLKPHFFTSLTQRNCQCFISINPLWWISRQFHSYRHDKEIAG